MVACGYGLQPSEFWQMHPDEWWWFYESKLPPGKKIETEDDKWSQLYDMLD